MGKKIVVIITSLTLAGALVWHRATEAPPEATPQRAPAPAPPRQTPTGFTVTTTSRGPIFTHPQASNPDPYTVTAGSSKHLGPAITVKDLHPR